MDAKLALAFRAGDVVLMGASGVLALARTEAPDFADCIADMLRKGAAEAGMVPPGVDLILPQEEVITVSVTAEPGDHASAMAAARAEIDACTASSLDELEIVVAEGGGGWVAVAAERSACAEARRCATKWGFAPLAVRGPVTDAFPDGPLFEASPRRIKPLTPSPVLAEPVPEFSLAGLMQKRLSGRRALLAFGGAAALVLGAVLFLAGGPRGTPEPEPTAEARLGTSPAVLSSPAETVVSEQAPQGGTLSAPLAEGAPQSAPALPEDAGNVPPQSDSAEPSQPVLADAPDAAIANRDEAPAPAPEERDVSPAPAEAPNGNEPLRVDPPITTDLARGAPGTPEAGTGALPVPLSRPETGPADPGEDGNPALPLSSENAAALEDVPVPADAPREESALVDAAGRMAQEGAEPETEAETETALEAETAEGEGGAAGSQALAETSAEEETTVEAGAEPEDAAEPPGPGAAPSAPAPGVRPESIDMTPTALALAAAPTPKSRPKDLRPSVIGGAGYVDAPRRESVVRRGRQNAATVANAMQLNKLNLLGVFGTKGTRRALLRLPGGEIMRVKRGTVVDGWTVSRIEANAMRLSRGGRSQTLRVVQ